MDSTSDNLDVFRDAVDANPFRLDIAAFAISSYVGGNSLDITEELVRLDDLSSLVTEPTLDGVFRTLCCEQGFRGDQTNYYDVDNSYLDLVLNRRCGIPITLSVLLLEVGRRVGVPLFGVGMPGHFLVGDRVDKNVFIDLFNGAVIHRDQARELFHSMNPNVPFQENYLDETPTESIVLRMLNNLRMIAYQNNKAKTLIKILELMTLLEDCPLDEFFKLASALEGVGRIEDAARYLDSAALRFGGSDGDELRAQVTRLWARLN